MEIMMEDSNSENKKSYDAFIESAKNNDEKFGDIDYEKYWNINNEKSP